MIVPLGDHRREETPGRFEPPPCRYKPPRFARKTKPPPCSKSLRCAINGASAIQHSFLTTLVFYMWRVFFHFFQQNGARILLKLMLFNDCHDLYLILTQSGFYDLYLTIKHFCRSKEAIWKCISKLTLIFDLSNICVTVVKFFIILIW